MNKLSFKNKPVFKDILRLCHAGLCNSYRAKWVTSFLMLYVLGTVYFVREYVFNSKDLNSKLCIDSLDNSLLSQRATLDQFLYQKLLHQPVSKSTQTNDFILAHEHIYLYSAYLDDRKLNLELKTRYYVKIVSILLRDLNQHYLPEPKCHLKYNDHIDFNESVTIVNVPEDHSCCYTAAFILCPVTKTIMPTHVAVTIGRDTPQWLTIQSLLDKPIKNQEISVCVRPFYGAEISIIQLSEFISYHSKIGVDHFQFYNVSASTQIKGFLDILMKESNVDISLLQWSVPLRKLLIHEWGQLAFIQDCILRWQTKVKYIIILDLDELIVPQKTLNLKSELDNLHSYHPSASAFIIPSILFCEEYLPEFNNASDLIPYVSLYHAQRQRTAWPHRIRSKYVVLPSKVTVTGIHFVWESYPGFQPVNVHASDLLINHYRTCCNTQQPWFFGLYYFDVFSEGIQNDTRVGKMSTEILTCDVYKVVKQLLKI